MRWILLFLLAASWAPSAYAMGKKIPPNRLTFHLQGNQQDGPKYAFPLPVYGKQVYFRRSPEIVTKDVIAFKPFLAKDGSYGATFYLSKVAKQRLAAITTKNQKSWFATMLNGRPIDCVFVDRPVEDGQLVAWQGLTRADIGRFTLKIPYPGDSKEMWTARKKAAKKELQSKKK
ncbi:MAG: hypothetical protein ACON5H_00345 [Akkermansiaceae bacterium]